MLVHKSVFQSKKLLLTGSSAVIFSGIAAIITIDECNDEHKHRTQNEIPLLSSWRSSSSRDNDRNQRQKLKSYLTKKVTIDIPTREEQIQTLSSTSKNDKEFDILVIGGGATGGGIALDAATRGLYTALIERGDFGNETSSRSTKLIWAGIRYIATATAGLFRLRNLSRPIEAIQEFRSEFKMVSGAHHERKILVENNPHLVQWIPIAVPIHSWVTWPPPFSHPLFSIAPIVLPAVFKFYDGMSGFTCPSSHIMTTERADRKFPQLATEHAKYYQVFYEAQHNDSRTATYIALTAAEKGAVVSNYTEMIDVLRDENGSGKAIGVRVRDNLTKKEFDVFAKSIIFAGGPFTDSLRKIEDPSCKPAVAAAAGTHIVLPGYFCPKGLGMLDINTSDGRFLFFLPWQGKTLIGTTDRKGPAVSYHGPPEEEITWLLNECQKYLDTKGGMKVRRSDVLSAWQGFRPLASDPNAPPGAPISRDHVISIQPQTGITFITGGKWTTYREMARDAIDKVIELNPTLKEKAGPCITHKIKLRGGEGYSRNVPIQLVQDFGISLSTAEHLSHSYGMNAYDVCRMAEPTLKSWPRFGRPLIKDYPYLECEIEYACRNEMVCTVKDMLTLRTRLAYIDASAARAVAPKVADLMSNVLGWSKAEKKRQLDEALKVIDEFGGPVPKNRLDSIHNIHDLFKAFDADGSGYIDYSELKEYVKHMGFPFRSEREAKEAFSKMDKNKDGMVSEREFTKWWNDPKNAESRLKLDLSEKYRLSAEKLGEGSENSGAAFG
jgi:glycerol-3-phosphate dehydrogenase